MTLVNIIFQFFLNHTVFNIPGKDPERNTKKYK